MVYRRQEEPVAGWRYFIHFSAILSTLRHLIEQSRDPIPAANHSRVVRRARLGLHAGSHCCTALAPSIDGVSQPCGLAWRQDVVSGLACNKSQQHMFPADACSNATKLHSKAKVEEKPA